MTARLALQWRCLRICRAFHAPDLAYHVHVDHLLLLLKNSADQWNTLVNFESALRPLGGQLSVGDNIEMLAHVLDQRKLL